MFFQEGSSRRFSKDINMYESLKIRLKVHLKSLRWRTQRFHPYFVRIPPEIRQKNLSQISPKSSSGVFIKNPRKILS